MNMTNRRGISPAIIAIIIISVVLAGGLTLFFTAREKANTNTNLNLAPVANSNSNANTNQTVPASTAGWQTYRNNTYGYQLNFPDNWYYLPKAMSGPLPPVTAFFSSQPAQASTQYASVTVLVSELMGENLATWSEIKLLEQDGYTNAAVTVDGQDGIRLERHATDSDNGGWLYVVKGDYMYRFTWGATDTGLVNQSVTIFETIINSIKFVDLLAADFNQDGVIHNPVTADDTDAWHLLYSAAGSPGLSAELTFDYQYIPSVCVINNEKIECQQAIDQGLLNLGDDISVQGYEYEQDKVAVFQLTK